MRFERCSEFVRAGNTVTFTHPDLLNHPHPLSNSMRAVTLRLLATKLPPAQAAYIRDHPDRADVAGVLEIAASPSRVTSALVRYRTQPLTPMDVARAARMRLEERTRPGWINAAYWDFFRGNGGVCHCFLGFRIGGANRDEHDITGCDNCTRNPHVSAVVGVDVAMWIEPRALFTFITMRPGVPHYFQHPSYTDGDGVPLCGKYLLGEHDVTFGVAAPDADGFTMDHYVRVPDGYRTDGMYGPHYPNPFVPGVFAFGDFMITVGREGTEFGPYCLNTAIAMPIPAGMARPTDWLEHHAKLKWRRRPHKSPAPAVSSAIEVLTAAAQRLANTEKESTVISTLRRKCHSIMPEGTSAYELEEMVQRAAKRAEDVAWKTATDAGRVVNW